jgi:hypothetical protein
LRNKSSNATIFLPQQQFVNNNYNNGQYISYGNNQNNCLGALNSYNIGPTTSNNPNNLAVVGSNKCITMNE